MTSREFDLLVRFMRIRAFLVVVLSILLALIVLLLVYALREEGTNETLTAVLGLALGALGSGLGVLINATSRDIGEYLKDTRQMPQRADIP